MFIGVAWGGRANAAPLGFRVGMKPYATRSRQPVDVVRGRRQALVC